MVSIVFISETVANLQSYCQIIMVIVACISETVTNLGSFLINKYGKCR